ncbi:MULTISPECIES: DUF664 domain-containing protein [Actinomadura]|uniref:mycothiol transferase n=1 Tax=Actinomadura TaxID=1988 RepID=UPI0030B853A2
MVPRGPDAEDLRPARRTAPHAGRAAGLVTARTGPAPRPARTPLDALQEYARHAGHLDIARELIDGETGE